MTLGRREFLFALPIPLIAARELRCDVAVIGGGVGGCAAALAALRLGKRVVMTEETDWVGGQLTSQAVPPDEHPWIEQFGATELYRTYRHNVREYYRQHYPLHAAARAEVRLNPGGGVVSRLTHEPKVSLAVLEQLLAPYVTGGHLILALHYKPLRALTERDRVRSVTVQHRDGRDLTITAPYFIDATEQGDLLPLTNTEFVTGFESRRQTGEPHAPLEAQPDNIQAFTVCFAVDYLPGEDHTIDKPREYAFWRDYVPSLTPSWPGKLLSWSMTHPVTLAERKVMFDPVADSGPEGQLNLFRYRQIVNHSNFDPLVPYHDVTLVNWPQNDYWLGNLHGVSEATAAGHLERGRQLSLSLLYWMQTEAGWKGLRLRTDITGTADGLAKYPYIRESRRIQAEFTVLEQHVGAEARKPDTQATRFTDSVGVGSYRIDLHPSSGGDNYIDISSLPFQIPLGALIPQRVENLIAGAKNLGVTHITNGCYRLHPVEWNIGESAGSLAAYALQTGQSPRAIRNDPKALAAFQQTLTRLGVELAWPELLPR